MLSPLHLPETLRVRYKLLGTIGSGGMGIVYKAHDSFLDKPVAIKVLHQQATNKSAVRFQKEGRACARLSHKNIVTALDFGVNKNVPYLVMDYIEGQTLSEILKAEGTLPLPRALPIFIQICNAIAHAHGRHILHRDIKPSNIMLVHADNGKDLVKILDFGIVKFQEKRTTDNGATGEGFDTTSSGGPGTMNYMSPEQASGQKIDER